MYRRTDGYRLQHESIMHARTLTNLTPPLKKKRKNKKFWGVYLFFMFVLKDATSPVLHFCDRYDP